MDYSFLNPVNQYSLNNVYEKTTTDLLNNLTTESSSVDDFKEIISMMVPLMSMQSFGSSGFGSTSSSSSENTLGFDLNSMIAPIMMNLMEQLMSKQLTESFQSSEKTDEGMVLGLFDQARSVHINQFDAELQVGGDGTNANCGP
ncbi:MAG: hypothetical protein JEZ03_16585, partial [Bacteroidales bacterium]|nr:hypothetical protein [Bacteroidales bacterium]